jgi:hypothetical protein
VSATERLGRLFDVNASAHPPGSPSPSPRRDGASAVSGTDSKRYRGIVPGALVPEPCDEGERYTDDDEGDDEDSSVPSPVGVSVGGFGEFGEFGPAGFV